MRKFMTAALAVPLLCAGTVPASAQYNRDQHRQFYDGARQGGRDGNYGNDSRYNDYDRRHGNYDRHGDYDRRRNQGGIGPGKGALIGGAGGAALGAVFGGGAKGALIGGAAGAGIGALIGKQHQNTQRRDRYGRPY
ncbi:MAG TPA: hypothetical protein VM865_10325 [Acidobacteriaceae bacterium]|jgi:hypothetical protein|nr:hypothetical protein [Acidobacteriaceae bacterium]